MQTETCAVMQGKNSKTCECERDTVSSCSVLASFGKNDFSYVPLNPHCCFLPFKLRMQIT